MVTSEGFTLVLSVAVWQDLFIKQSYLKENIYQLDLSIGLVHHVSHNRPSEVTQMTTIRQIRTVATWAWQQQRRVPVLRLAVGALVLGWGASLWMMAAARAVLA